MENMDMFDSKGTANNFPINLIVSFVNISFLFFDNNLTTSDKIVFTESSRSSSGQHFIVKLIYSCPLKYLSRSLFYLYFL